MAALLLACPLAAQASRPASWMPLDVGASWEYAAPGGERVFYDCVGKVEGDGGAWFTITRRDRFEATPELWSTRGDGVYRRAATTDREPIRWEQPLRVLQLPPGISASWQETKEAAQNDLPGRRRTLPELSYRTDLEAVGERVETPSGTHRCARVVVRSTSAAQGERETTYWFARGIGIVKLAERAAGAPGWDSRLVLVRYLPPSAPPDADLVTSVERALAEDQHLAARGEPLRIEQLRGPELRRSFASRFVRVHWTGQSSLLREHEGRTRAMDLLTSSSWNELLADERLELPGRPVPLERLAALLNGALLGKDLGTPWAEFAFNGGQFGPDLANHACATRAGTSAT